MLAALLWKFGAPIRIFIEKYLGLLFTAFVILLLGGFYLLWRQIIDWRIPAGIMLAVAVLSSLLHVADANQYPGPRFSVFAGSLLIGAFFTALVFGFIFGRPLINALRRKYAAGQPIREDGPAHHIATKAGTPTMGGLLILAALTLSTLIAFPAGIWAAARRGKPADIAVMGVTQLGVAIPNFWFAMMLVAIFAVHIGNGLFMSNNGYEFALALLAATVSLCLAGAVSSVAMAKKPPKPPPPKEPPPPPRMQISKTDTVVQQVPQMDIPQLDVPMTGGAGMFIGNFQQVDQSTEGDIIPIVRINPIYPRDAAMNGIEGWVKLEFTITETGTVKSPKVVDSKPPRIFNREAMRANIAADLQGDEADQGHADPDEAGEAAQHQQIRSKQTGQSCHDPGDRGREVNVSGREMAGGVEKIELVGKIAVCTSGRGEDR